MVDEHLYKELFSNTENCPTVGWLCIVVAMSAFSLNGCENAEGDLRGWKVGLADLQVYFCLEMTRMLSLCLIIPLS